MSAATQLSLYNGALRELGERKLASLSENVEGRRALDDVWTAAFKFCLEQGQWKFAQRTSKMDYDPSYTPPFGYTRQFVRPADCVRLTMVCSDEFFNTPLLSYAEEAGFWFANLDSIYVSYVSNDSAYGGSIALWPETYVTYVEFYLAVKIAKRLGMSGNDIEVLKKEAHKKLVDARSKDAMESPTKFPPQGAWVGSRSGRFNSGRRDGGNRSGLIG